MTELGLVDGVKIENRQVSVNVFVGPGRTMRNVPFVSPMQGMWVVPEVDQVVEIYEIGEGKFAASLPHSSPDHDPPDGLGPGDLALTLNSGTALTFLQNPDGTYDIDIKADGDITIDGIDFDEHTHDYKDDDGTSTATKTTEKPN